MRKIMMMTSQNMKIILKKITMTTMTMKIVTMTTTTMMMTMTAITMMKMMTTMMITAVEEGDEVVEIAETEISKEITRADLLQEVAETEVDREDDQIQPRLVDPILIRVPDLQEIHPTTIIMITDMIIREDQKAAETAAEGLDLILDQAQDLQTQTQEGQVLITAEIQEARIPVTDQTVTAVQVVVPIQDQDHHEEVLHL